MGKRDLSKSIRLAGFLNTFKVVLLWVKNRKPSNLIRLNKFMKIPHILSLWIKNRKRNKFIKSNGFLYNFQTVFFWIVVVCAFGFTLIDYILESPLPQWAQKYFGSDKKPLIYITFGFLFSFVIYLNQNKHGKIQFKEYKKRLDELEAVSKTKEEIQQIANEWFDGKTEVILFYFPYTVLPGYWLDGGKFFEESVLKKMKDLKVSGGNIKKIYFIGAHNKDDIFKRIIELLNKNGDKTIITKINDSLKNRVFEEKDLVDVNNIKNGKKLSRKIEEHHDKLAKSFKQSISNKKFITIIPKFDWEKTPNYSFVLRKTKDKNNKLQLMIIDTFEVINDFVTDKIFCPSFNVLNKDSVLELFQEPPSYFIRNDRVLTLFVSTLFQTIFQESRFRAIKKAFLGEF